MALSNNVVGRLQRPPAASVFSKVQPASVLPTSSTASAYLQPVVLAKMDLPTPEKSVASPDGVLPPLHLPSARPVAGAAKSQRVLACVLCQQRKVKCDRNFPCANCQRANAQCIPAGLTQRPRRRRFPERELLERLRHYEDLLRQHGVDFQPLHPSTSHQQSDAITREDSDGDVRMTSHSGASPRETVKSEKDHDAKTFWQVMKQNFEDGNDQSDSSDNDSPTRIREAVVKRSFDRLFEGDEILLFGARHAKTSLAAMHPSQANIFRLWQIYLDNVNALLKVTHTPTLQARIVDAINDLEHIDPVLESLLFSIYCVAVQSLSADDCQTRFGVPKNDLLTNYRYGCQQALLRVGFLRSSDRDTLVALFLYLVSARRYSDPRSLSCMFGVSIRLAKRIGIHSEAANARCPILEAEMRRRLWWAMLLFDVRISEMSDHKVTQLDPTWDCKTPLNINDFDLQAEMSLPPVAHSVSAEALFTVVRAEILDFIRNCQYYLTFVNPALMSMAREVQPVPLPSGGDELIALERRIEEKYLRHCDPQNPLHFMTIWTARGYIAKNRLIEQYARQARSKTPQSDAQRDAAIGHAMRTFECDTTLLTSPLIRGYAWLIQFYFPFPAYLHLTQDLKRRPVGPHARKCWEIMDANYQVRFSETYMSEEKYDNPHLALIFCRMVMQAWQARDAVFRCMGEPEEPPQIVRRVQEKVRDMEGIPAAAADVGCIEGPTSDIARAETGAAALDAAGAAAGFGTTDPLAFTAQGFGNSGSFPMPSQAQMEFDFASLDWNAMAMNSMNGYDWMTT